MTEHVTTLICDAPGCEARFSSKDLPAFADRYVLDAASRRGWTVGHKILCPAHSEKFLEAQILPAEKAVRLLINNPSALRSAPPFLVGKLKLHLTDFNARTFTWKKS